MEKELQEQLAELKKTAEETRTFALLGAKEVLDLNEASLLLGLSKPRIYALTSSREIPHYKQGRLFFKKKELEAWLTQNRVQTRAEIESKAISRTLAK